MRNHRRSSSGGDGHGQRRWIDNTSWEHLPWDLQARILCLLAVSDLLRLLAVSRSFLNLIRSPAFLALLSASPVRPRDQVIFLFTQQEEGSDISRRGLCFHPSTSRLFLLPLLRHWSRPTISFPCSSAAGLAFSYATSSLLRLLSRSPPRPVTPPVPSYFAAVAVVPANDDHFFLLAVAHRSSNPISAALYDSRDRKWTPAPSPPGPLDKVRWRSALPPISPCIAGRVFLLARTVDSAGAAVVVFHVQSREWEMLPTLMPGELHFTSAMLFSWDSGLFLAGGTGGQSDTDFISGIRVWKMEWEAMEWCHFCSVPEDTFHDFLGHTPRPHFCFGFTYADGILMAYFFGKRDVLLLLLSTMEWRRIPDSDLIPEERKLFYGLVATPAVDLLMPASASEQQPRRHYDS